jgi:hypothetical protein
LPGTQGLVWKLFPLSLKITLRSKQQAWCFFSFSTVLLLLFIYLRSNLEI